MDRMQPRPCRADEHGEVLSIINEAAERYRGVIPDDRWHEPYMDSAEFGRELIAGVAFWGVDHEDRLAGVMGVQPVKDVDLIRHAYVRPALQGQGIGTRLLARLAGQNTRPVLVGTWAAAEWAIGFYRRHGFDLVDPQETRSLLQTYWSVPDRQIETSVVLRLNR
jgi:GNAT superfamily N-acetyltransferase